MGPDTVSHWLTDCDLRVLADAGTRPHVYLLEPLRFWSDALGTVLEVPAGAASDLASVPDAVAPIAATLGISVATGIRAACLHDWLVRTAMPRETADAVYHEALLACRVPEHAAAAMYQAVALYTRLISPPPPVAADDGYGGTA